MSEDPVPPGRTERLNPGRRPLGLSHLNRSGENKRYVRGRDRGIEKLSETRGRSSSVKDRGLTSRGVESDRSSTGNPRHGGPVRADRQAGFDTAQRVDRAEAAYVPIDTAVTNRPAIPIDRVTV